MGVFAEAQDLNEEAAAPTENRVFKPSNMPLGRVLAAVMRSAAAVQGQEQAKKVANEQQTANAKLSVTMTANPNGGPPLVNVKNAPADLLNGTQADDVKRAYAEPKEQVERKLSASGIESTPMKPDPALEEAAAALDSNFGYRVARPWDPDIAEKLKSEDGIRALAEEMGDKNPKATAKQAFKQLRGGTARAEAVIRRVQDYRAQQIQKQSQTLQSTLGQIEAKKDHDEQQRRLREQFDATERQRILARKKDIIEKTPYSLVDPGKLRETLEAENDTGVPFTEFEFRRAELRAQQTIAKDFEEFTSNAERFALGRYETWDEAKSAFGHRLSPQQEAIGRARWDSARKYVVQQDRAAAMKNRKDEVQLTRLRQIVETATAEKPAVIGRADLALMPAAEIVAIEPSKVRNYDSLLEQKEGLLAKELREWEDKRRKSGKQRDAIRGKKAKDRQFGDEEQLAGYEADFAIANEHIADLTKELEAIRGKRAERSKPATVNGPPKVKYRMGPDRRYIPQVETAIEQHRQRNGFKTRAEAVESLRKAGYLE